MDIWHPLVLDRRGRVIGRGASVSSQALARMAARALICDPGQRVIIAADLPLLDPPRDGATVERVIVETVTDRR